MGFKSRTLPDAQVRRVMTGQACNLFEVRQKRSKARLPDRVRLRHGR